MTFKTGTLKEGKTGKRGGMWKEGSRDRHCLPPLYPLPLPQHSLCLLWLATQGHSQPLSWLWKKMNPTVKKIKMFKRTNNPQRWSSRCPISVVSVWCSFSQSLGKVVFFGLFVFPGVCRFPSLLLAVEFARKKLKRENPLFPLLFGWWKFFNCQKNDK